MARSFAAAALLAVSWLISVASNSYAAPCLIVTLTGTQGGPQSFNGLAGAGTLVRFGDDADECGAVKLQFDAGRGTTMVKSGSGNRPSRRPVYPRKQTSRGPAGTSVLCHFRKCWHIDAMTISAQ